MDEFVEKSPQPLSTLASMGIYIFNKDILAQRLREDAARVDSPHDFGYAILPGMIKSDKVFAYEFSGYWQDIGTVKAYYETNMELLAAEPLFNLDTHDWPILTNHKAFAGPEICRGSAVSNSLIGPGCKIEGRVENSILSPGVYIGEQAVVRNSIIMANTTIGSQSVIERCILDENVKVDKFCKLGFAANSLYGNPDVTVIGKDAVVSLNSEIGRIVKVQSKVKPADFVTVLAASGSGVSSDRK